MMYYILLMGSGFVLAFAIGQLCVPRRTETNNLLCQLLLVSLVWLVHGIGFKMGMLDVYPHLNKIHVPFLAATGPLWYLYVRTLLMGHGRTKADRTQLLPVLASTVLLLPFFLQPQEYKREYIEVNVVDLVCLMAYAATRIAELATIVYLAFTIRLLQQYRTETASTNSVRIKSIMIAVSIVALTAAVARLLGSVAGNHTVSVILPIAIILLLSIGLYCFNYRHDLLVVMGEAPSNWHLSGLHNMNEQTQLTISPRSPSDSLAYATNIKSDLEAAEESAGLHEAGVAQESGSTKKSGPIPGPSSVQETRVASEKHNGQAANKAPPREQSSDRVESFRNKVRKNGWHLDPNLKIDQLARRLGLPAHNLSEIINTESSGNFNHFINGLRIEHAKKQLREHAEKPVIDIALSSGFNSASAFYAQFTRFESMPPASYRRRVKFHKFRE